MNKKKIIIIIILVLTLIYVVYSLFKPSPDRNSRSKFQIGQNEDTKKSEESIRKDNEKENERLKKIEEYTAPGKNSQPLPEDNLKQDSNYFYAKNEYVLYKNKYLDTEQYVEFKEDVNLGVSIVNKIYLLNLDEAEKYYNSNKDKIEKSYSIGSLEEFKKLKNKFSNPIKEITIDENTISKNGDFLNLKLIMNNQIQIPVLVSLKDNKIKWILN